MQKWPRWICTLNHFRRIMIGNESSNTPPVKLNAVFTITFIRLHRNLFVVHSRDGDWLRWNWVIAAHTYIYTIWGLFAFVCVCVWVQVSSIHRSHRDSGSALQALSINFFFFCFYFCSHFTRPLIRNPLCGFLFILNSWILYYLFFFFFSALFAQTSTRHSGEMRLIYIFIRRSLCGAQFGQTWNMIWHNIIAWSVCLHFRFCVSDFTLISSCDQCKSIYMRSIDSKSKFARRMTTTTMMGTTSTAFI